MKKHVFLSTVAPTITILKFFKSNAIIVKKGSAIDIPAEVKGLPLPTFQWMKDDLVLEKPDEEKMTMETEEVRTDSFMWAWNLLILYVQHFVPENDISTTGQIQVRVCLEF